MAFKLCLAILVLALFASCSASTDTISIGASMTGSVTLYNTDLAQNESNASGVTVALQGTAYSTTTESTGKWTLVGVPPGIYTIVFSKPGYDSMTVERHKFSGAGVDFIDEVTLHLLTGTHVALSVASHDPAFATDSDVVVTLTKNTAASATVTILVSSMDPSDSTGWKLLTSVRMGTELSDNVNVLREQMRDLVWKSLGNVGGTVHFKAAFHPDFGPASESNVADLVIAPDSLIIERILVDTTLGSREQNVSIFGHSTFYTRSILQLYVTRFSSLDSSAGVLLYPTYRWTGRQFTIQCNKQVVQTCITPNHDSSAVEGFFTAECELPLDVKLRSNRMGAYLPR